MFLLLGYLGHAVSRSREFQVPYVCKREREKERVERDYLYIHMYTSLSESVTGAFSQWVSPSVSQSVGEWVNEWVSMWLTDWPTDRQLTILIIPLHYTWVLIICEKIHNETYVMLSAGIWNFLKIQLVSQLCCVTYCRFDFWKFSHTAHTKTNENIHTHTHTELELLDLGHDEQRGITCWQVQFFFDYIFCEFFHFLQKNLYCLKENVTPNR